MLRSVYCGTYFTHVQTCNVTRVQSATEWTASVHTLHMSKPLSVFKCMLLLALLVVLSSCDTSEPSYTKQSFMNAKEHSNTETLFQRNAEAFGFEETPFPKLILRRSKPSFPSIPNIHLTSQQTRDRSSALLPPQT